LTCGLETNEHRYAPFDWQGQQIGTYTVLVQQSLAQMQWVPPNRHEGVQLVGTPFGHYLRGLLVPTAMAPRLPK
jgi:hypothetical protein